MVSTCRKAEMALPDTVYQWTDKSKDILFETTRNGVGDGEDKVAAESGTVVLGQNSSYDLLVEGKPCDVKKLDAKDDFNTGKTGRVTHHPNTVLHTTLFASINSIADNPVFTNKEKEMLSDVKDFSCDELGEGKLRKIEKTCKMLNSKKQELRYTIPVVTITIEGQTVKIPLDKHYSICQTAGLPFPPEFSSHVERIKLLQKMDHVYIDEPDKFMQDLNSLVEKIFSRMGLIIVHKKNGYMRLKDASNIRFLRITRGCPRFQVIQTFGLSYRKPKSSRKPKASLRV